MGFVFLEDFGLTLAGTEAGFAEAPEVEDCGFSFFSFAVVVVVVVGGGEAPLIVISGGADVLGVGDMW